MAYRRTVVTYLFSAALCLAASAPADAARIYNYLAVPVLVQSLTGGVTLAPGERSGSVSWVSGWVQVFLKKPSDQPTIVMGGPAGVTMIERDPTCRIGFNGHSEITGGNYMIIGSQGTHVSCVVCDSNYRQLFGAGGQAPRELEEQLRKHPSSKTGC